MGDSQDAVNYITGYTTKHESSHKDDLFKEMQGSAIDNRDMFRICIDLLRKREVGMPEIVDMLMGHSLRSTDTAHVFINTNAENGRQRMLKSKSVIDAEHELNRDDVKAYLDNWNDEYYPQRSPLLEDFSLFNLRIYYKKVGAKARGEIANEDIEVLLNLGIPLIDFI